MAYLLQRHPRAFGIILLLALLIATKGHVHGQQWMFALALGFLATLAVQLIFNKPVHHEAIEHFREQIRSGVQCLSVHKNTALPQSVETASAERQGFWRGRINGFAEAIEQLGARVETSDFGCAHDCADEDAS